MKAGEVRDSEGCGLEMAGEFCSISGRQASKLGAEMEDQVRILSSAGSRRHEKWQCGGLM